MARRPNGMSDTELASLLDGQITDAVAFTGSELKSLRSKALQFVDGEVDIPAEEGKSSVVSHDVADTLHWIMPGLLRVFLGSDHVAVYEPNRPQAEAGAKQATDYVNYCFLTDCAGYKVLHAGLYDGLLFGNGVLKHWWDPTPEYTTESFTGLSDDAFTALVADEDVEEVLEHTERPDPSFTFAAAQPNAAILGGTQPNGGDPTGGALGAGNGPVTGGQADAGIGQNAPQEPDDALEASEPAPDAETPSPANGGQSAPLPNVPLLHDCKIKRITRRGRLMVRALPAEEFLLSRDATAVNEEETTFAAHTYRDTRSNLVKAGYDRTKVDAIPIATTLENDDERQVRESLVIQSEGETDRSTEKVQVYECYVLCDYDGDGIAEWRKVVMGGNAGKRSILANDEWGDDLPFTDLVPEPVPHRWRGRSLFDDTADVQRIKTTLLRQTLDNLYLTNNPMQEVVEGQVVNMDALVNREIGGVVITKQQGAITTLPVEFTAQSSFGMLDYLDKVVAKRTGVSDQSMGIDPDALTNETATAASLRQSAAYAKTETYARNTAEVGLKRLFKCLLKLIVKHQDRSRMVRLRGQWVEMDPRGWDADMDVTINVGLGTGSRDRDIQFLMGVKQTQELIIQTLGPTNPLAPLDKYRNTLAKLCEAGGVKSPEQFFGEITPETLQQMAQSASQPKPDPKMAEVQAKIAAMQQESQAKLAFQQQQMQADAQAKQQQAALDWQHKQQQAAVDNQHREAEAQARAQARAQAMLQDIQLKHQLATEQAERDFRLKQMEIQANAALKQRELDMEAALKREQMMMQPATPPNIQEPR